jgi:hypothetical protein
VGTVTEDAACFSRFSSVTAKPFEGSCRGWVAHETWLRGCSLSDAALSSTPSHHRARLSSFEAHLVAVEVDFEVPRAVSVPSSTRSVVDDAGIPELSVGMECRGTTKRGQPLSPTTPVNRGS